jgi:hypothetical protein|tara:strand:- start:3754 stop:3909 length:156 start_codon:yes stop_codon:yes gene_type:complete
MSKLSYLDCTQRDDNYYNNLRIQLKYFKDKKTTALSKTLVNMVTAVFKKIG